jgi:putative transposase
MSGIFYHRNIRLPATECIGKKVHFLTLCCANRHASLSNPWLCKWLLGLLAEESATAGFLIPAYCFMPYHLHLLIEGISSVSNLLVFIKVFKHKAAELFHHQTGHILWQKNFYDHILRYSDSPGAVAWYIWLNPVRKGLAAKACEFPFAGSFTDLDPFCVRPEGTWKPRWKL